MEKLPQEVLEAMAVSPASGMAVSIIIHQGMVVGAIKGALIYVSIVAILFAYRVISANPKEDNEDTDQNVKKDKNWRYT